MKIALISCSNGIKNDEKFEKLLMTLKEFTNDIELSSTIFKEEAHIYSGEPKKRASELNRLFQIKDLDYIFDISGGDSGNEILEYLDYESIKNSKVIYAGYSDLSTVINALYTKSGKKSYYYNTWNLISEKFSDLQKKYFKEVFIDKNLNLNNIKIEHGNWMDGKILAGNLRCFSKLLGTEYCPDFTDNLILIEAWSGDEARFRTYLYQMKQAGIFKKARGIILGTFTELEKEKSTKYIYEMALEITEHKNIVKLGNIGHNKDSFTLIIG